MNDRTDGRGYQVGFERIRLGEATHFLPEYARHRPAVRRMASGVVHEPGTHARVAAVLEAMPGSVVHAGTFFGDMLPTFSRACRGQVHAFEPVLENYVLARLSVEENRLDNVLLLHAALGRELGLGRMDTGVGQPLHAGGASRLGTVGQRTNVVPLDLFDIRGLSLVHLDVEGHELPALLGGLQTIRRELPVIAIEDNRRECAPLLEGEGYRLSGSVNGVHWWLHPRHAGWALPAGA